MVDTYDGVNELAHGFAGFLCSEDYGDDCADNTIGDFLEKAKFEAGNLNILVAALKLLGLYNCVWPMSSSRCGLVLRS